ncbi:MAG: deoxyhypusine synthase family protein [Thermodesulfobacteriota bacterium]
MKIHSLWEAGKNVRHWEGLSGCTFEESQSWGKISEDAKKIALYCDSVIALPLNLTAVAQESAAFLFRRIRPEMRRLWSSTRKRKSRAKAVLGSHR